jgi:nicotinamidase-related amidase
MKRLTVSVVMSALLIAALAGPSASVQQAAPPRLKPALLVIDIQNAFLPLMEPKDRTQVTWMINSSISLFRFFHCPVIRVHHTDPGYGPAAGTKDFDFPQDIEVKPDDPQIVKNFPNAFKKTGLEKLLRDQGVNAVFLCGLSATGCVLATYHGALDLDFDAFMIKDALMSPSAVQTGYVEAVSETVGYETMRVMLQNAAR